MFLRAAVRTIAFSLFVAQLAVREQTDCLSEITVDFMMLHTGRWCSAHSRVWLASLRGSCVLSLVEEEPAVHNSVGTQVRAVSAVSAVEPSPVILYPALQVQQAVGGFAPEVAVQPFMQGSAGEQMASAPPPEAGSGVGATAHAAPPLAPPTGAEEPTVAGGMVTGVATAVGVAAGAVAGVAGVAASAVSSLVGSAPATNATDPEPEHAVPDAQPEGMSLGPEPVDDSPPAAQPPNMGSLGPTPPLASGPDAMSPYVPGDPSEAQAAVPSPTEQPPAPVVAGTAEYPAEPQQSSVQAAAVSAVDGGMGATTYAAPPLVPPSHAVSAADGGMGATTYNVPPLAPPPGTVSVVDGPSGTEFPGGGAVVGAPAPGAGSAGAAFTATATPATTATATETARAMEPPAVVAAPMQAPLVGSAEPQPAATAAIAPLTATPAVLSTDESLAPASPVLVSPFAGLASVPVRYSLDESETRSMVAPEVRCRSCSTDGTETVVVLLKPRPQACAAVRHPCPRTTPQAPCIHLYLHRQYCAGIASWYVHVCGCNVTDMSARPAQASMQESSVLPPPNTVIQSDGEIAPLPPALMPAEAAGVKAPPAVERRSNGAAHDPAKPAAARPAAARAPPAAQDKVKAKGCFCFA